MSYLLDTHTLIWALTEPGKLSDTVRTILLDRQQDVIVSTVSFWEISLKYSLQKLTLEGLAPEDFPQAAIDTGFQLLAVDARCTATYHRLTATYHKDSFDRMLIWQALQNNFRLLSRDPIIARYASEGLQVIW